MRPRRPPWWPEGEPFPPHRPPWVAHGRRRFMRRFLLIAVALAMVVAGATAFATWLLGRMLEPGPPLPRVLAVAALLVIVLTVARLFRALGRLTLPVGDLVEAAERFEQGDFGARVAERGSPELRRLARAINSMAARLAENEARRRGFLAGVTHEFRTPLAIIRGHVEAVADGVYPADAEHLAPVLEAAATLERLVDDLRTLAATETGTLTLRREPVDLPALAHEVVTAAPTGPRVEVAVEGDPAPVDGDAMRLRSVLANLVANAVRHAPRGRVRVSVRALPAAVEVTVADDGPGMEPELAARAFERFVRGPGSDGSGLGLAIVKELVEAHGGSVDLVTEPGRGTEVKVVLPASRAAGPARGS